MDKFFCSYLPFQTNYSMIPTLSCRLWLILFSVFLAFDFVISDFYQQPFAVTKPINFLPSTFVWTRGVLCALHDPCLKVDRFGGYFFHFQGFCSKWQILPYLSSPPSISFLCAFWPTILTNWRHSSLSDYSIVYWLAFKRSTVVAYFWSTCPIVGTVLSNQRLLATFRSIISNFSE